MRVKAPRHEAAVRMSQEWLQPREPDERGRAPLLRYLTLHAESDGRLQRIALSLRSIYNLQFTTSPICKS